MRMRWWWTTGVALALGLPAALCAQTADQDETGRATVEKWIETRRLISQEKQDWRIGRDVLESRVGIIQKETAALQEKIGQATNETADVDRKLADLSSQEQQAQAASERMRVVIADAETRVKALLERTPEPVREKVKQLSQRLPQNSADTKIGLPERYQNVIGILNELGKANGEIARVTEIRDLGGKPTQVETVYVGLAQAYYVSAAGEAGIGRPGANGWQWQPSNALAPRISEIIQMLQNKASAQFVSLPVKIP